jgi:membrane peptidoglycan carboxypeptidase
MARRRAVAGIVVLLLAAPSLTLAVAWLATPGVGDLPARLAERRQSQAGGAATLREVTPLTVDALVATEDERYWSNAGVDIVGLLRAIPYDVSHLSMAQGGSTLTEQLAKNLWLRGNDGGPWSKVKDMALALKLDRRYSKNAILGAYLNTAYFGEGSYGIDRASRRYFGVPPGSLDAAEATTLVGLVQAPSSYDLYTHPSAARLRQIDVLRSLVRVGRIREATAARLLAERLRLADGSVVPGLTGVTLSRGPAVAWRSLGLAIAAALAGLAAIVAGRVAGRRHPLGSRAAGILAVCLLGAALVEGFRSVRVV